MCGLAGVAYIGGAAPETLISEAARMGAALTARGPDGVKQFTRGPVAMEFHRLAINDLAHGDQPFVSRSGEVVTATNGEIFNHRELRGRLGSSASWASECDCEVVRAAYERWGTDAIAELRGMYAGAIVDYARAELLLFRDRFGIKPLFYDATPERILFASEVKALASHPRHRVAVDWQAALADPALNGTLAAPAGTPPSFFRGATPVPPGGLVRYNLNTGTATVETYWDAGEHWVRGTELRSPGEIIEAYRDLLTEAVREALMSDVPVGCFLSGGVDSAVIAALAARSGFPLECFSVVSDSTIANGDAHAAQQAGRQLGIPVHLIDLADWATDRSAERYLDMLAVCETPLFGPEQVFKLGLHRHIQSERPGTKVVLTGQGSDEFNGGYTSLFGSDWDGAIAGISVLAGGRRRLDAPVAMAWREHFGQGLLRTEAVSEHRAAYPDLDDWQIYTLGKVRDLATYNCWHEDRTASYHGIENRVPFLDHRLVELCLGVDPTARRRLFWDKAILRDAARWVLPPWLADRPKVPFFYGPGRASAFAPLYAALAACGGELFDYAMSGPGASEYLDIAVMRKVFTAFAEDTALRDYEFFHRLVNLALLDRMLDEPDALLPGGATEVSSPPVLAGPLPAARDDSPRIDPDLPYRLADEVRCLAEVSDGCSPDDVREWYFCLDGQIEYVLHDRETGRWRDVVARLDGRRTLTQACASAGAAVPDIAELAQLALDAQLLVPADFAPTARSGDEP